MTRLLLRRPIMADAPPLAAHELAAHPRRQTIAGRDALTLADGRAFWIPVTPRRSIVLGMRDGVPVVAGVIHGLALAPPPPDAPDTMLVRPARGAVELIGLDEAIASAPVLDRDDLRHLTGPDVWFERDVLAWIQAEPDERTPPHRAIVVVAASPDPALEAATAGFCHGLLPPDGEHTPPRSIEGIQHEVPAVQLVGETARAETIRETLAALGNRFVTIELADNALAALAAVEAELVEDDLLIVLVPTGDGHVHLRARLEGHRAGFALAPPLTWSRVWSTVSYRLVQLSRNERPLLGELGGPLYIEPGFFDLLERPEPDARQLLLARIDAVLDAQNRNYAERLVPAFEQACRRAGDAVNEALCLGLYGRIATLAYKHDAAIAQHRRCIDALVPLCPDDAPAMTRALFLLGGALARKRDPEALAVFADTAARIRRREGSTLELGNALYALGAAQRAHGDNAGAVTSLREAAQIHDASGAARWHHALQELELALEADARFREALTVTDEMRGLADSEWAHNTIDEARARCLIGLGDLAEAASILTAVRRRTAMYADKDRIDALLASLPAEIRAAPQEAARAIERAQEEQALAATPDLRTFAAARGMVLVAMRAERGVLSLDIAPAEETDGPARPSYRERRDALVAEARARIPALPAPPELEVRFLDLDHRAGRMYRERDRVAGAIRELWARRANDYGDDDPFARVELIDVTCSSFSLGIELGTHGPAGHVAFRDLSFELIAGLREMHPDLADLPITTLWRARYPGRGAYPYDGAHLAPVTVALLEHLRRLPRRATVDRGLLARAAELRDDERALVHTLAVHQVDGEGLGDALVFEQQALESMRRVAFPFVLAYDFRGDGRTLVVNRENLRHVTRWWPGLWSPDEIHSDHDRDNYSVPSLRDVLGQLVAQGAAPEPFVTRLQELHAEHRAAHLREAARAETRARRFATRGWVSWIVGPTPGDDEDEREDDDDVVVGPPTHLRATPCDVEFTADAEGKRDRVWRVARDGTRTEIALPSAAPYRRLASLTPDRTRMVIASRTRVREIDLASGSSRLVMEGPWVTSVACLADDLVVFASAGGEHTLDRHDPDVAALSSVRQLPPGDSIHMASARGLGLCRIGDDPAFVRWIDVDSSDQLTLQTACDGRILILGGWKSSLVLAVKDGELIPLRAIDRPVGQLVEKDGRIVGHSVSGPKIELLGLEAAWQAAWPYRVAKLRPTKEHDVPAPRRVLVGCEDDRVFFERVDAEPPGHDLPAAARRALAVGEADLLWGRSRGDDFVLIRGGSLRLVRADGDRVDERVVTPPIEGEHAAFAYGPDGRLLLAGPAGIFWIDGTSAAASPIAPWPKAVASVAALSDARVLVLSRHSPTDVRLDLVDDCHVVTSWPVHVFDQIHALPGSGLIILSFQYMAADQAAAVLLHISSRGTLHSITDVPLPVRDAFERDGRVYLDSGDGVFALTGLDTIGPLDGKPPLAGLTYEPPVAAGAAPEVRKRLRA